MLHLPQTREGGFHPAHVRIQTTAKSNLGCNLTVSSGMSRYAQHELTVHWAESVEPNPMNASSGDLATLLTGADER